jgi:uncharacterized protein YcnI
MSKALRRAGAVTGIAATLVLAGAGVASAHVTVNAPGATAGGFAVVTFRVPTESDTASTSGLKLLLPADQPLAFVSVQPKAGWTYTVQKTKLATPISSDDGQVTEAVSEIDWTASTGAIKPGEFDEFRLSVGPLPNADQLVFKAIQHYSDGKDVAWIEQAAAGAAEPAHPAPTLKLATSAADSPAPSATQVAVGASGSNTTTSNDASKGAVTAALAIAGVGVVLGAGGLGLGLSAWRRTRTAASADNPSDRPTVSV